jgi:hypothetical protein
MIVGVVIIYLLYSRVFVFVKYGGKDVGVS